MIQDFDEYIKNEPLEMIEFAIKTVGHVPYLSAKRQEYEICLEPCFNGYDVAIYGKDEAIGAINQIIGSKQCTDIEHYDVTKPLHVLNAKEKALEIANIKYKELYEKNRTTL